MTLHFSFLTLSTLNIMAGAPTAAPLLTVFTVAFKTRSRAAVQTAVLQLPPVLDLDPNHSA